MKRLFQLHLDECFYWACAFKMSGLLLVNPGAVEVIMSENTQEYTKP